MEQDKLQMIIQTRCAEMNDSYVKGNAFWFGRIYADSFVFSSSLYQFQAKQSSRFIWCTALLFHVSSKDQKADWHFKEKLGLIFFVLIWEGISFLMVIFLWDSGFFLSFPFPPHESQVKEALPSQNHFLQVNVCTPLCNSVTKH